MIEARNLVKRFGDTIAVDNVSFSIKKGEVVGFLGPNGAGKSTTMRMICGYFLPDEGTAEVCNYDILENPLEVRKHIGYLPENTPLYYDMDVISYLEFVASIKKVPAGKFSERIRNIIDVCGLKDVLKKSIGALSKGYRQRVGLAQAMIHDPEVLVLDEPTSGLDPNQIKEIRSLIREISRKKTIILSTHILPEVEATCDRVIIINEGKIVTDSKISELSTIVKGENIYYVSIVNENNSKISEGIDKLISLGTISKFEIIKELDDEISYKFFAKSKDNIARDIFLWAKDNDLILTELRKEVFNLEDIFSNLTVKDE